MKPRKIFISELTVLGVSLLLAGCGTDPDSVVSKSALAVENGDYSTAVSLCTAAVGSGADDKSLLRLRGIAEMGEGQFDAAVKDFISYLSMSNGIVGTSDIDTSYYLAVAQYKNGDADGADATLSAITDIRPKEDKAYLLRGKVRLSGGNREAAMSDFDRAVALAPTKYDYYVEIYEELFGAGYESEAGAYLEKALAAGNKLSDYYKGVLEYYMGSYTDARNDLENARKDKNNENITLYLGKTYEALGDISYARTLYEENIQSSQAGGRIYEQLSYLLMNQGEYNAALSVIESGLSLGGGEGIRGMMFNRVVAYERLYDFDSAGTAMDEYLSLYPDDEDAVREQVFLSSR